MADLDSFAFKRIGNHLVPADIHADEYLHEITEGKEVLVKVHQPRSPHHHRWVYAMLHKVVDNIEWAGTFDDFMDALKIEIGHADRRVMFNGNIVMVPRSIDWASVDQVKFKRLVNRMLFVIQKFFGIDGEALMKEVGPMPESFKKENNSIEGTLAAEAEPQLAAPVVDDAPPLVPAELSESDRALLRKLSDRCANLHFEPDLKAGDKAFRDKFSIAPGSPMDLATREIVEAHRLRIKGQASIVETEDAARKVLA